MNSRTKGLDGRLQKIEEEVEQQQITNRQDNIVFFGVPEKEGRESSDDYASTMVTLLKAGLYKLGSRGGSLKFKKKKKTAWSSVCPNGTYCTPPKPHKLATQLPACSVHLTRLLPGGSYFYVYTSLMGPRHPTVARWNKQFQAKANETKFASLINTHNRPNALSCYP